VESPLHEQVIGRMANIPLQKAFLSLGEVIEQLGAQDYWPASPIHINGDAKSY
jgi:hypothetical protein